MTETMTTTKTMILSSTCFVSMMVFLSLVCVASGTSTKVLLRTPKGTSDACSPPPTLKITISRDGKDDVTLQLLTNQIITVPRHVVLMSDDPVSNKTVYQRVQIPESGVAYHSVASEACFIMHCSKTRHTNTAFYTLEGTFFDDGVNMKLSPTHDDVTIGADDVTAIYVMEAVERMPGMSKYLRAPGGGSVSESEGVKDYLIPDDVRNNNNNNNNNNTGNHGGKGGKGSAHTTTTTNTHRRRRRRSATVYHIDVLPILDFYLYSRWLSENGDNPTSAGSAIVSYMTNVFTSISLGYNTLNLHDNVALNIRMLDPLVSTTAASSSFTEDNKQTVSPGYHFVHIENQLDDFTSWVGDNIDELPYNDHIMLFSGYEWYGTDISSNSSTPGLAWLNRACNREGYATSVVQDRMAYQSEIVAAHELGHNLGAYHDGDDNSCSASAQYIMSAFVPSGLNEDNMLNPRRFSSCSSSEISSYVQSLETTSYLETCLQAARGSDLPDEPTTTYNVEDLCPALQGNQSTLCWAVGSLPLADPHFCTSLYCTIPSTTSCDHVIPPSGTCCAKGKYCVHGVCSQAPSGECVMDDDCPFADNSACSDVINGDMTTCFEETVYSFCCTACANRGDYAVTPTEPPVVQRDSKVIADGQTVTMNYGQTYNVQCSVEGGTPRIHTLIISCTNMADFIIDGYTGSAVLHANTDLDGAQCLCSGQHFSNSYTLTSTFAIDVQIVTPTEPPVVQINSKVIADGQTVAMTYGHTYSVQCSVEGGTPRIHTLIISCTNMDDFIIDGYTGRASLHANTDLDGAQCRCSAQHISNSYTLTSTFAIDVQIVTPTAPPVVLIDSKVIADGQTVTMNSGQTNNIQCSVEGGTPPVHTLIISCTNMADFIIDGYTGSVLLRAFNGLDGAQCRCSAQHISNGYTLSSTFVIDVQTISDDSSVDSERVGIYIGAIVGGCVVVGILVGVINKCAKSQGTLVHPM